MELRHGDTTLTAPDDWEDQSQLVVTGPVEDGFRPSLVVSTAPLAKGETPGQFAEKSLPGLKASLQGLEVREEGPILIGDRSAYQREYTFRLNALELAQIQVFVPQGSTIRTLTFTQLAQKLEASRPLAKKLFDGVKLDGAGAGR